MGFLKFLKREKGENIDELDLPPAPPTENSKEDMTFEHNGDFDLPKFDESDAKTPDLDFNFSEKSLDLPDFDKNFGLETQDAEKEDALPLIPTISAPPVAMPPQSMPQPQIEIPKPEIVPEYTRRYAAPKERHHKKEVYVRVDKFKIVVDNISTIRSSLRKSDEALMKLEHIKNSKDRFFDKVKSSLDDLQKKLIFVDKTLFKGD